MGVDVFELTTCVMVDGKGRDCLASRADWSPLPLCVQHLREAYLAYAERLQYLTEITPQDRADAGKMVIQPGNYLDERDSVVYYIRIGHFVKIGTTVDMYNRMSTLQPDEILATELGGRDLEVSRHQQFAHIRAPKGREYFYPTDELMAHITEVKARWIEPAVQPKEPTAGHQAGVICPACDLKAIYRAMAHGPACCASCGYVVPDTDAPA